MNQENITVLRKILYAVESGGQIYGRQNYAAFAGVGKNTPNEVAITIGAGQWYGARARLLLQRIQANYPADFSRLDTAGIAADLKKSWDRYGVTAGSAKGKCIIAIISSAAGIKCQDALMNEQIVEHAASIEKIYGSMPDTAMMECINIVHLGGMDALKRILKKTAKPYTAESIYAALNTDPTDPTPNQVGDYVSRQQKVYEFITKYAADGNGDEGQKGGNAVESAIKKLIQIAKNEAGYLEKASNSQLDSKTANAGSANITKYWRDVYPVFQGQAWCACFVSWCFKQAFGQAAASKLLKHWPYVYCPTLGDLFARNANPKAGDIVIFYRNGSFAHTGIVTAVNGDRFYTVEGNTSGASGIIPNGGGVCEKNYLNSQLPGTKFCTPDYSILNAADVEEPANAETEGGKNYMFSVGNVQSGSKGNDVKLLQRLLKSNGFRGADGKLLTIDGDCGTNTVYAIKSYQKKKGLSADGIAGPATWKSILLR